MSRFYAFVLAALALTAVASPTGVEKRANFLYRFYAQSDCNHGDAPGTTYPPNNQGPISGSSGNCYSAPTGTNWQRLEINEQLQTITYCNIDCTGSGSVIQTQTDCFVPFPGCAIGSFKVVS